MRTLYYHRDFTFYIEALDSGRFATGIQPDDESDWFCEADFETENEALCHALKEIDAEIARFPDAYSFNQFEDWTDMLSNMLQKKIDEKFGSKDEVDSD